MPSILIMISWNQKESRLRQRSGTKNRFDEFSKSSSKLCSVSMKGQIACENTEIDVSQIRIDLFPVSDIF